MKHIRSTLSMTEAIEQKLKTIQKKIVMASIIDLPAALALGFALHAKFSGDVAIHSILNDASVVNVIFVVGGGFMLWSAMRTFRLMREKTKLQAEKNHDRLSEKL